MHVSKSYCVKIQQSLLGVQDYVPLSCNRLDDKDLYQLFVTTADQLMEDANPHHLLEKEQLLADLMLSIFEAAGAKKPLEELPQFSHTAAKKILQENLEENLSIEDLANQLQSNPFTLIRQFKKAVGTLLTRIV